MRAARSIFTQKALRFVVLTARTAVFAAARAADNLAEWRAFMRERVRQAFYLAIPSGRVWIRAGLEQLFDKGHVTIRQRKRQRCFSVLAGSVYIGARIDQFSGEIGQVQKSGPGEGMVIDPEAAALLGVKAGDQVLAVAR